ncbi:unnamed protein product [Protopolystoma xenopodis]|uniref:Uncharacterized protein n=1 Tax=Protopolystoma xenopodis TaxID=117903 RepID=A0A3S5B2L7_9PLAT|nr:unnamed protein product [Protopolystoma xenopodis]
MAIYLYTFKCTFICLFWDGGCCVKSSRHGYHRRSDLTSHPPEDYLDRLEPLSRVNDHFVSPPLPAISAVRSSIRPSACRLVDRPKWGNA